MKNSLRFELLLAKSAGESVEIATFDRYYRFGQ